MTLSGVDGWKKGGACRRESQNSQGRLTRLACVRAVGNGKSLARKCATVEDAGLCLDYLRNRAKVRGMSLRSRAVIRGSESTGGLALFNSSAHVTAHSVQWP